MKRRYLMVRAAAYRLLIDAALVEEVSSVAEVDEQPVDLSRALGGEAASVVVVCATGARARYLGVDEAPGLVDLAEDDFVPLPSLILAAAGEDIDRVTRQPLDGAHAFRLRLDRSTEATAASDHQRSERNR